MTSRWVQVGATLDDPGLSRKPRGEVQDVLVSPRSLDRLRGVSVRHVHVTERAVGLPEEVRLEILAALEPALGLSRACRFCGKVLARFRAGVQR